jgi:hypothetical protein
MHNTGTDVCRQHCLGAITDRNGSVELLPIEPELRVGQYAAFASARLARQLVAACVASHFSRFRSLGNGSC